jgi:4-hydroxy-tetrahydrodipicolinate synthase
MGVVIYKRGPDIPREVLIELCEHDQVVAVKFAMADVNEFAQTVQDVEGEVTWVNGIAERWALSFAIEGATGYTTGIGNFLPRATLALHDAIQKEQWDRARTIQRSLRPLEDLRDESGEGSSLESGNNVPVVKHGMDLAGYTGGRVRVPLVDLSEQDETRLERHYDRIQGTFDSPVQSNQQTD